MRGMFLEAKGMKRKVKAGKRKNESYGNGMLVVFLITLCLVLSIGVAGLIAYKILDGDTKETYHAQKEPSAGEEKDDLQLFQEKIPDSSGEEKTGGADEAAKEAPTPAGRYDAELADEAYMKENRIIPWESSREDEVSFCFAGDFLLDDEYAIMANLLNRGAVIENGISEGLLAHMRAADIMVINNEFPYTNRGTPTEEKTFTFRADTDKVSLLQDMGADVAILANNR